MSDAATKQPLKIISDPTSKKEYDDDIRACLLATLARQIAAKLTADTTSEVKNGSSKN